MNIQVDDVILTVGEIDDYLPLFPTSKPSSVLRALAACKQRSQRGRLDTTTVNYFLQGAEFGGVGMGVDMAEEDIRHVRMLCDTALGIDAPAA
jgi:hypothetical protein